MPTGPAYVARSLSGLPALPGDDERHVTGQVGLQDRQPAQGSLADPPDDEPAVRRVAPAHLQASVDVLHHVLGRGQVPTVSSASRTTSPWCSRNNAPTATEAWSFCQTRMSCSVPCRLQRESTAWASSWTSSSAWSAAGSCWTWA